MKRPDFLIWANGLIQDRAGVSDIANALRSAYDQGLEVTRVQEWWEEYDKQQAALDAWASESETDEELSMLFEKASLEDLAVYESSLKSEMGGTIEPWPSSIERAFGEEKTKEIAQEWQPWKDDNG